MNNATAIRNGDPREAATAHTAHTPYLRSSFQARQITRSFLSTLSPRPSPEVTESVLLVVSELVTNALRHANGVTGFHLGAAHRTVTVEVEDSSSAFPRERLPGSFDEAENGGFGWPIVRHLANDLTVRPTRNNGKIIQARLPL
ncbi:ATP-binding protein [Streptomyces axinellae]|uniref:Histidine kinase/HSP90-like ATPase domain-containing protein n=1 Tax=Streptomyces axinellae TaxID=552788 RepID=A0ABN3Q0X7_9ACTN